MHVVVLIKTCRSCSRSGRYPLNDVMCESRRHKTHLSSSITPNEREASERGRNAFKHKQPTTLAHLMQRRFDAHRRILPKSLRTCKIVSCAIVTTAGVKHSHCHCILRSRVLWLRCSNRSIVDELAVRLRNVQEQSSPQAVLPPKCAGYHS